MNSSTYISSRLLEKKWESDVQAKMEMMAGGAGE
jgi:hypothetical protein